MTTKNRNYYTKTKDGTPQTPKIFLVRYEHPDENTITNEGPFTNKTEATEKLTSFLKKGICSWLVSYND
jgi:hypothetical protein